MMGDGLNRKAGQMGDGLALDDQIMGNVLTSTAEIDVGRISNKTIDYGR